MLLLHVAAIAHPDGVWAAHHLPAFCHAAFVRGVPGGGEVNSSIIMATEKHVSGLLVIPREARKGKAEETEGESRREEKCEKANAGLVGD